MTVFERARKAIESTYDGIATVTIHEKVTDKKTHLTGYQDMVVLEKQPCRLSFQNISSAKKNEQAAGITQVTKLFISPSVAIEPGSKITVTQAGMTTDYTYSGVPAVYSTHQEIVLELFERWA